MKPRPAGAGGDGIEDLGQEAIEERLRRLSSACAVPAAAAVVTVGALGWTAERDGGAGMLVQPPAGSFLLALGALLMVLLSSGVHRRILRRAVDAASEETAGEARGLPGPGAAELAIAGGGVAGERALLGAYSWATGVSFGMLGVAVVAGALVGLGGGAPFYGLVICLASLLAMVVRWPRRGHFDVALERESLAPGEQRGPGEDGGGRV